MLPFILFFLSILISLVLVIEIHPFCMFSGHKRFTELLTKDEKGRPDARVSMEKILTLPELKVESNFIVNHKNFGSMWIVQSCALCS